MEHPTPDKLSQKLCRAIAAGIISVVKNVCQKRLRRSKDKTLGYFDVVTLKYCSCLAIPNYTFYNDWSDFTPDGTSSPVWNIRECSNPPRLREIICAGRCICLFNGWTNMRLTPGNGPVVRKMSPLVLACYYGQTKIARYLLRIDRTALNFNEYMTPLMMTTLCRSKATGVRIAKILLKAGADLNVVDNLSRFHVLEFAAWQKNSTLVKFLLKQGVDVNSLPLSPLLLTRKSKQCTRALLNGGAQVLNLDVRRCPLQHALKHGASTRCIRQYLESPSFRKEHVYVGFDATWLQMCLISQSHWSQNKRISMLQRFLDLGLPVDSYVPSTARVPMQSVATGLSWDFVFGSENLDLGPATFLAVLRHLPHVLEYLLHRGAQVNFRNVYGMTALMVYTFSASYNYTDKYRKIVSILCNHGIDLNARDIWGRTAVFYAVAGELEDPFVLTWMLKKNIDMFAKTGMNGQPCEKRSPFYIACEFRCIEYAQLLLAYGFNIRKETWLMQEKLIPEKLLAKENTATLREFLSLFTKPDDLRSLCRREIRKIFGVHVATGVKQLGLPVFLQDYVMCQ